MQRIARRRRRLIARNATFKLKTGTGTGVTKPNLAPLPFFNVNLTWVGCQFKKEAPSVPKALLKRTITTWGDVRPPTVTVAQYEAIGRDEVKQEL